MQRWVRSGSHPCFSSFFSPLPLIASISVSHIKSKSKLVLSNNLNLGMFGRGSQLAAIIIQDAQWSMKSCIYDGIWGENIKIEEVAGRF